MIEMIFGFCLAIVPLIAGFFGGVLIERQRRGARYDQGYHHGKMKGYAQGYADATNAAVMTSLTALQQTEAQS